jgi:hypothetical protein
LCSRNSNNFENPLKNGSDFLFKKTIKGKVSDLCAYLPGAPVMERKPKKWSLGCKWKLSN